MLIKKINKKVIFAVVIMMIMANFGISYSKEIEADHVSSEVIVKVKNNDNPKTASLGFLDEMSGIVELEMVQSQIYRIRFTDSWKIVEKTIKKYSKDEEIEIIEPNYFLKASVVPDDTLFSIQWGLQNTGQNVNSVSGTNNVDINATEAWSVVTGDANTKIAILDTGVNYDHEDLIGRTVGGYDFVNLDADPLDDNGHGTMLAGIIGATANNNKGIAGLDWNAKIIPVKVLDNEGTGTVSDLIQGINYAVNNGADIINMSLIGGYSSALDTAIKNAYDNGLVLVSAAGNDSVNLDVTPLSPISNDGGFNWVVGVSAIDQNGKAASFSNYGSKYIDVVAPGVNIISSYKENTDYVYSSGTSVAAGFVSGVAGLIKDQNSTLGGPAIKQKIINGVNDIGLGSNFGGGNVDAYKSLQGFNIKKIGVMKKEGGNDHNFYVYDTPGDLSPQLITGSDLWNIPFGDNTVSVTGVDIDGDGKNEVAVMKNEGGDYNLYIYNSPGKSNPQLIRAMDLWNIPSGDNTVAIAGVDYDGNGTDELAVMKNENGDYNLYIYFAPTTTEATFLIGGDKWNIPGGDNVIAMTGLDIDGDLKDEIAVMKNEGGDYNLYIYRAPNGMEATTLVGTDKWEIPSGNNTVDISGIDYNGDGIDELGIMKNETGDYNFYIYQSPVGTGAMPQLAGDKWNIPSGDNIVGIATME